MKLINNKAFKPAMLIILLFVTLILLGITYIKVNEYGTIDLSLVSKIETNTYGSFIRRLFSDGFFPESVYLEYSRDHYDGFFYRTAYVAGVVFVDNNEISKAEILLDYIANHQGDADYLPHINFNHVNVINENQSSVDTLLYSLEHDRKCAQKFKATTTNLTGLKLFLDGDECNGDIIVEIRSVTEDSHPECGAIIGNFTIGKEHFGNWEGISGGRWRYSDGFSYLKLKDDIKLTLENDYFIVLKTNSTSSVGVYGSRNPASYRGIDYHAYVSSTTGWLPKESEDIGFVLCHRCPTNIDSYSMIEQVDVIGWTALLYEHIYEKSGKTDFRDKYYSFIRDRMNWCKGNRYNQSLKLIRNLNLEHTIGKIDVYDIYTNSILAVAYKKMSRIADEKDDIINRDEWQKMYINISEGINTNLVTMYNFTRSYLDVEFADNSVALYVIYGDDEHYCGQSWTSNSKSTSTKIERICVTISRVGAPPSITLNIYEYGENSKDPRGGLLGAASLSYEDVSESPDWVAFDFSEPLEVKELTTYYLELTCVGGDEDNKYVSYGSNVNRYDYGNAWSEIGSLTHDMAFKIYSSKREGEPTTTLRVYEQFINASDGTHHLDFSWITLTPYIVGWDGLDETRLYNTWEVKRTWDWSYNRRLLPLSHRSEPMKSLTKDIAWDMLWCYHLGHYERVQDEVDFISENTLSTLPFYESYVRFEDNQIHWIDAGNGEQSGWMLYTLNRLNACAKDNFESYHCYCYNWASDTGTTLFAYSKI